MNSLVSNKIEALAEGFPTLLAHIGLLPIVNSLVPDDMRAVDESLPTVTAFIGLLPRMNALVFHHIRIAFEAPVTDAALVRPPFPGASAVCPRACTQGSVWPGYTVLLAILVPSFLITSWALSDLSGRLSSLIPTKVQKPQWLGRPLAQPWRSRSAVFPLVWSLLPWRQPCALSPWLSSLASA